MKPEMENECSKLFKEGDRVVVYSMKDQRPIFATVRWTGAVRKTGMPSVIYAGLECMTKIYVHFYTFNKKLIILFSPHAGFCV